MRPDLAFALARIILQAIAVRNQERLSVIVARSYCNVLPISRAINRMSASLAM